MNEAMNTQEAVEETIPVTDLDEFIHLLTQWHNKATRTVEHLRNLPEGMEVKVEGEESFTLQGDSLRGFKLGVELSLNYLGTLPFAAEYMDASDSVH